MGWAGLAEKHTNRGERKTPAVGLRRPDLGASGVGWPGNFTAKVASSICSSLVGVCMKMLAGDRPIGVNPVVGKNGLFRPNLGSTGLREFLSVFMKKYVF